MNYCITRSIHCEKADYNGICTASGCLLGITTEATKIVGVYKDSQNNTNIQEIKKTVCDTIFQLKCAKEHLKYLFENGLDNNVDFDIKVIDTCISNLENINGKI